MDNDAVIDEKIDSISDSTTTAPPDDDVKTVPDNQEALDKINEALSKIDAFIANKDTTPKQAQEAQEKKDELEEYISKNISFIKENRNPATWAEGVKEIVKATSENVLNTIKKQAEEAENQRIEEEKKTQAETQEYQKQTVTFWESQLDDLEKRGLIPEIAPEIKDKLAKGKSLSKEEGMDAGVKARYDIYQLALDNKYDSMKEAYYELYAGKSHDQPGKNAPVSGGRAKSGTSNESDIPYAQLRRMSYDDIIGR